MILTVVLAAGVAAPPESDPPDTELLEFIGTFESSDGQWLDPLTLDDVPAEPPVTRRVEKQP